MTRLDKLRHLYAAVGEEIEREERVLRRRFHLAVEIEIPADEVPDNPHAWRPSLVPSHSPADAREAHNLHVQGINSEWVRAGERQYQREHKRKARKAKMLAQSCVPQGNSQPSVWENVGGPEGASTPESLALTAPLNATEQRG